MKLSKEVVDLECGEPLDFNEEYQRIIDYDPEFAKILEYFEEQVIEKTNGIIGVLSMRNYADEEHRYLREADAINVLQRAFLNLHRIFSAQAEIDEAERECGYKS